MTFVPRKYKDIFDQMRAMSQVVTDFEVGSVARTMYESFSYELALLYEKMQLVYLSAYVDTAEGFQLDQVVSVLGIQRSQPDYAEGIVKFQRDGAGQEIIIPIGTLVATEESSTGVKKVFQTIKEGTLAAVQTSVDVQVRSVERGEDFETAAETVIVMPRPVPGIKSVTNDDPVRLVGKRRETDEELRARAKNALISSGKATILSIENTLLSLSGVRDVRVRENFHFARATINIVLANQGTDTTIARGTMLKIQPGDFVFRTIDPVSFSSTDAPGTDRDLRIEAIVEGKIGELGSTAGLSVVWDDAPMNTEYPATLETPAKLEDFGLIEVYVDSPRLESENIAEVNAEYARLQAEIEKVRAAGIFALVRPATKVRLSAVFRIEINPSLSLNAEERRAFEESVEDEIVSFIGELRMGKPFLYGKLIKAVLSLDNIENLTDFKGITERGKGLDLQTSLIAFSDAEKAIRVEEFERVSARHICVATEDKPLKLHIAFQKSGMAVVDETVATAVNNALTTYLGAQSQGVNVAFSQIQTEINNALTGFGLSIAPQTFELRPETWCPGPEDDPRPLTIDIPGFEAVVVTFVERPALGVLFAYNDSMSITGAIKLVHPLNILQADAIAARNAVVAKVEAYLAALGPEEDIVFEELVARAQSVDQVLAAEVDPDDFMAFVGGAVVANIIDNEKIDIPPYTRAFAGDLLIGSGTFALKLNLDNLTLTMGNAAATQAERDAVAEAARIAWNNVLNGYAAGDDVSYTDLKSALENLVPSVPYTITQFDVEAVSDGDGRSQVRDLGDPTDIHTRSIEVAAVVSILANQVTTVV